MGALLALWACGGGPETTERPGSEGPDTVARDTLPDPLPPPMTPPPTDTPPQATIEAPGERDTIVEGEELPAERVPPGAYEACRDSVAATLPDTSGALWADVPDNVKPAGEPGRWAVLAQVRPDSTSPGVTYACLVEEAAGAWRVLSVQTQPSEGEAAPP